MRIEISSHWLDVAEQALTRIRTLEPDLSVRLDGSAIVVDGHDSSNERDAEIARLIDQTLYRERIYMDTLSIRNRIYNG